MGSNLLAASRARRCGESQIFREAKSQWKEGDIVFGLGVWEIVGIIAIILLLFGASMIPRLLRGTGQGIRELKQALREPAEEPAEDSDEPDTSLPS